MLASKLRQVVALILIQLSFLSLAGPFDRRNLPSHSSRAESDTVTYHVRTTSIALKITLSQLGNWTPIMNLLSAASETIQTNQQQQGLGLVPGGQFIQQGTNVVLKMWNANNHQLTWGVVGVVVMGLLDWIAPTSDAPAIVFKIFDGANQVGQGQIAVSL
ncbi:hypothetical protein MMC08_005402 [Hypocenomyce scalaris]|nr:hypothetical protein [Hypocenomyce scalaris]